MHEMLWRETERERKRILGQESDMHHRIFDWNALEFRTYFFFLFSEQIQQASTHKIMRQMKRTQQFIFYLNRIPAQTWSFEMSVNKMRWV